MSDEINYDKWVRDNIPDIIRINNGTCSIRTLETHEIGHYAAKKLVEEIEEFKMAKSDEEAVKELADIQDVMDEYLKAKNISPDEFRRIRDEKNNKNGRFEKRILLISATKP